VAGTKEFLGFMATAEAQEVYVKASTSTVLPVNSNAKTGSSALVDKGKKLLADAKEITQFFNRDSSDALQPTADTALIKFFDQPDKLDSILADWQTAAEKVWKA
jgi:multiple sugar transport system substrate-binding protein